MAKPSTPKIQQFTLSEKQRIYQILTESFDFDVAIPMAKLSKALIDAGVDKAVYGYKKAKDFCLDMPEFLTLDDIVMGGVPQIIVTISKVTDWVASVPKGPEPVTGAAPAAQPTQAVETPPASPVPADVQQELQDVLSDFVYFPDRTMDILKEKVPNEKDYKAMLNEDYARAGKEGTIRYSEEKVLFPIRHKRQDGTPIVISIRRSSYATSKLPWYLSYIDSYVKPEKPVGKTGLGHELENFAYLGPWQSFLGALADKALEEPWDFEDAGRKNYDILKSYIRYTFYRLQLEDKVVIDDDNKFAAFNTGLVNEHYDDIYACFEPEQGDYEWRFAEFCTAGSRGMGKRLVRSFNPLPQPPSYFTRKEDLLFDLEKELIVDYEHILIDGIHRLPLDVLEEECRGSKEALGILGKIHATSDFRRKRGLYRDLADLLEEDHRLFNRLRSRLEYAISLAKRQVRWNYKMAIPSYYPRNNSMSLLMPLSLEDESHVDTALVVELLPSGNYQGQTILTLRQAYLDARLLCRPDSEWLTARSIHEATEDEEDDGE